MKTPVFQKVWEPGWRGTIDGEINSVIYSQTRFLLWALL